MDYGDQGISIKKSDIIVETVKPPEEKEEKEDIRATLRIFGDKKMIHLLPLVGFRGFIMAS